MAGESESRESLILTFAAIFFGVVVFFIAGIYAVREACPERFAHKRDQLQVSTGTESSAEKDPGSGGGSGSDSGSEVWQPKDEEEGRKDASSDEGDREPVSPGGPHVDEALFVGEAEEVSSGAADLPPGSTYHYFVSYESLHSRLKKRPERLINVGFMPALTASGFAGSANGTTRVGNAFREVQRQLKSSATLIAWFHNETFASEHCVMEYQVAMEVGKPILCVVDCDNFAVEEIQRQVETFDERLLECTWLEYTDEARETTFEQTRNWLNKQIRAAAIHEQAEKAAGQKSKNVMLDAEKAPMLDEPPKESSKHKSPKERSKDKSPRDKGKENMKAKPNFGVIPGTVHDSSEDSEENPAILAFNTPAEGKRQVKQLRKGKKGRRK